MLSSMMALALAAQQNNVCATAAAEARARPWYVSNAEIAFRERTFRKYGLPRALAPGEIKVAGSYQGVPVFLASDPMLGEDVVYVLTTSKGCEFQPYAVK